MPGPLFGGHVSLATKYSQAAIEKLFETAFRLKPTLRNRANAVQTTTDIEAIFREAVGVIDAAAGSGSIEVDKALLTALRGIQFDHQAGMVLIEGSMLEAPFLVTGGGAGATGKTKIKGSNLKSEHTEIKMNDASSITMTGGSRIIQR